jgi:hypothetical protein
MKNIITVTLTQPEKNTCDICGLVRCNCIVDDGLYICEDCMEVVAQAIAEMLEKSF